MKRVIQILFITLFSITCVQNLYSKHVFKPTRVRVQELITPKTPTARSLFTYIEVTADTKAGTVEVYFYRALGEVTITLTNSVNDECYTMTVDADMSNLSTLYFTPETETDYVITVEGKDYLAKAFFCN